MEHLRINNFLTIREAELDVRRFTILIGPQASGKSVVAKLLYFFRTFLQRKFIQSIQNQDTKRQLERATIASFEEVFPAYAWTDQEFALVYSTNDIEVSLTRKRAPSKKWRVKFDYSPNLGQLLSKARKQYKIKLEESNGSKDSTGRQFEVLWDVLQEFIYSAPRGGSFQYSVFIPAGRSFFATLQKSIFSFLASNIPIDRSIKEFGSVYESSKVFYDQRRVLGVAHDPEISKLYEEMKQRMEKILVGQYVNEDDQDWIVSGARRVNLANASSGQQEALPMLIALSGWVYRGMPRSTTFFIEEPEAHLFPVSQRLLVGTFSRLYATGNYNFLLTTHSPYVLTALNNLIMASNLVQQKGPAIKKRVEEIIQGENMIRFEDVAAYTITAGRLETILDSTSQLIGSSIIDSVSDEFDHVFDALMQLY